MRAIAELEQALMLCDWELIHSYDDVAWSVSITTQAEMDHTTVDRAGYLIS